MTFSPVLTFPLAAVWRSPLLRPLPSPTWPWVPMGQARAEGAQSTAAEGPPRGHPTPMAQDETLPESFKPWGTAIANSGSAPWLFRRLSPLWLPPQASALCEHHVLQAGSSHPHEKTENPKGVKKKNRGVKKEKKKNPQLVPWNQASTWSFTGKSIKLLFDPRALHHPSPAFPSQEDNFQIPAESS